MCKICDLCEIFELTLDPDIKCGVVYTKKKLTNISSTIEIFHKKHYLPALQKLKYHISLVILLGKNKSKNDRHKAMMKNVGWVVTERDYAERLAAAFDMEMQSEHLTHSSSSM